MVNIGPITRANTARPVKPKRAREQYEQPKEKSDTPATKKENTNANDNKKHIDERV